MIEQAKSLYSQTNGDIEGVTRTINAIHGTDYTLKEMRSIVTKGTIPRRKAVVPRQNGAWVSKMANDTPIGWMPPISTRRKGFDPLVKELLSYGARYNGLPNMTREMCVQRLNS